MDEDTLKVISEIMYAQTTLHNALINALVNKGVLTHKDVKQALETICTNMESHGEIADIILDGMRDPDLASSDDSIRNIFRRFQVIEGGLSQKDGKNPDSEPE